MTMVDIGVMPLKRTVANRTGLYLQAMRVQSLWISTVCVLTGGAVALWQGHIHFAGLALAWLGAVSVQAGTNLTNVFHNYKAAQGTGAEFDPQGSSAPIRAGKLTPSAVHRAAGVCFAVALVAGALLTAMYGWRILAMGIPGLFAGYFYGAPPVRLGYLGLGVVTVFVFMGPVMVIGTYWVQSGMVSPSAILSAMPIGLLAAGIMHINDVRDFETDVKHGKHTLSIAIGRARARWLLVAMNIAAYVIVIAGVVLKWLPWPVLLTFITIPKAVSQSQLVLREQDAAVLNRAWFLGVQLHTQFGLLFIGALVLATAMS